MYPSIYLFVCSPGSCRSCWTGWATGRSPGLTWRPSGLSGSCVHSSSSPEYRVSQFFRHYEIPSTNYFVRPSARPYFITICSLSGIAPTAYDHTKIWVLVFGVSTNLKFDFSNKQYSIRIRRFFSDSEGFRNIGFRTFAAINKEFRISFFLFSTILQLKFELLAVSELV